MASLPRPVRPLRRARRRGQPAPVTDENVAPPGLSFEVPAPQNNGGANATEVAEAMGNGPVQAFFFPGHGSVGASIVRISMPIQRAQTQSPPAPQTQANERTFPIETPASATAALPMAPKSPWYSDPGYTPWTLFSPGTLERMVEKVVGRRPSDSNAGPSRLLDLPSLSGTPSPDPMSLPPFPTMWGVDNAEERLQPRKRRASAQGGEGLFFNLKKARTSLHSMDFGKAGLETSADTPNGGASTSRVEATRPSVMESDGGDAQPKAGGGLIDIKRAESAVVELKASDGQGEAKGNKANTSSEAAADESPDTA